MNCHFDGIYSEGLANPPLPMPEVQTSRQLAPTTTDVPTGISANAEPALELLPQDSTAF